MEDNPAQPPIPEPISSTTPATEQKSTFPKWIIVAIVAIILITISVFVLALFLATTDPLHRFKKTPTNIAVQSPTATPTPNPTANWKIYTAINYSLKYPSDWFVNTSSDSTANGPFEISDLQNSPTAIIGASDTHTRIGVSYSTGSMPTNFPLGNGDSSQNPTIKPFSKNGYAGIRGKSGSTAGTIDNVLLKDPNGGYIWIQLTPAQKDDATSEKIFDQILSTFKFTNPTSQPNETASWKTYKDSFGGFSFKYPSDWETGDISGFSTQPELKYIQSLDYDEASFEGPGPGKVNNGYKLFIRVETNSNFKDYGSYKDFILNLSTGHFQRNDINRKEIVLDGQNCLVSMDLGSTGAYNSECSMYFNGKTIDLSLLSKDKNEKIFNQILSTFKFAP